MDFSKLLSRKEYNFLGEKPLGANLCLLTLGGSYAYGTNKTDGSSDIDIRGIATNSVSEIVGITPDWETIVETNTDTVVYSFNKIINLLISMNPNTCEMLGTRPQDVIYSNNVGKLLRDNAKIFLSGKAIASFKGYSNQQYSRMFNYYCKNSDKEIELREQAIKRSCENKLLHFNQTYSHYQDGTINLRTEDLDNSDTIEQVVVDIQNIKGMPIRQIRSILNDFESVLRDYDKHSINHRNKKSSPEKLCKHQMHLLRLYYMLLDILTKGEIITYREKEHDFLMEVRNGKFMTEDGSIKEELIEVKEDLDRQVEYAIKHMVVPMKPNLEVINDFVVEVNKKIIQKESDKSEKS